MICLQTDKISWQNINYFYAGERNDEIGILAQNINNMSERLDTAIDELKRANEKLVEDIEHERMLENQRKEFVAAVLHEMKTPLAVIQA